MKKYKLIKKLPFEGSPEIGYISKPMSGANNSHYWNHNWFKPEDYPEYWEEVVEKDYKILSLRNIHGGDILGRAGEINSWERGYGRKFWEIHSIKRLSDGEVFTLGNKVHWNWVIGPDKSHYTIESIYLDEDNNLRMDTVESSSQGFVLVYNGGGEALLPDLKHYKELLFTTYDGVDIYKGDDYYLKTPKDNIERGLAVDMISGNLIDREGYLYFSTREKAEEYILMNKPCLSINEVMKIHLSTPFFMREDLKKYVKSNKL